MTVTNTIGAVTTSVAPGCCPRTCTQTSMYGCPSSLGGRCCSYGFVCATGGACLSTVSPSTSATAVVSQVPQGCTTSQITCPASLGGGCCAVTQSCTFVNGAPHCANTAPTPTGDGISEVETQDLSTGAKAGISVGVVVGAGLLIGATTWFCLRKRRARRSAAASSSERPRPTGVIGAVLGSGGRDMSESSSVVSGAPLPGIAQDFYGPEPAAGPYTDNIGPSTGTTPGGGRGGVPLVPHSPGDIAVPVEIDSQASHLGAPRESASYAPSRTSIPPPPPPETTEGRFELYGSDFLDSVAVMPSPVTPIPPSPLEETPESAVIGRPSRSQGPGP